MIIGRKTLLRLIGEQKIVEGFRDLTVQAQPNGIDLTLDIVQRIKGPGVLDFDNTRRRLPKYETLAWHHDLEGNLHLHLHQGTYLVTFKEIVNIPVDMAAITQPRSSLLRCGCFMGTAFGDAGFRGKYQCLLDVRNENGLILLPGAKLAQLVFVPLDEAQDPYSGIYAGRV